MSDYTPTTEQVKRYWMYGADAWARGVAGLSDEPDPAYGVRPSEQFDRWLTAHDAQVKAVALEHTGYSGPNSVGDWSFNECIHGSDQIPPYRVGGCQCKEYVSPRFVRIRAVWRGIVSGVKLWLGFRE